MFSLNDSLHYWLWSEPTDMRKSFYSPSCLVRSKMGKDPLDGSVYVFINARGNRIKLLHMEPGGLVLYMKVPERGELHGPGRLSGAGTKGIEWRDLVVMIEGMIVDETHHYKRVRRVLPIVVQGQKNNCKIIAAIH